MSGKKHGNSKIGGDKKTRDKIKIRNSRTKDKKGGRTSHQRYKNYELKCYWCKMHPCKCK